MSEAEIIIDCFERQVERSPHSTALIVENGEQFSYLYLNDIATFIGEEIACALSCVPPISIDDQQHGGSDTPLVAVTMTRGVGIVGSILGILKAGAAYVPVDPAFPPDRQTHIFQQSKCQLLITDSSSFEAALKLGVNFPPTLVIDSSAFTSNGIVGRIVSKYVKLPSFDKLDKRSLLSEAKDQVYDRQEGGLAYVLYTSGSTGKPKGVMVRQDGVVKQIFWFAHELDVGPHSRVLSVSTFSFDISVLEMYLPLLNGGTQVLAFQSSQKDPFRLLDVIQDNGVTVMQATPTTYEMFFAIGWTGDKGIDFFVGGEAFRPSLLKLVDNCRSLRNLYGPTETTIWASSFLLPPHSSQMLQSNGVKVIPVGYPICDKIFYLVSLDEPKRLVGDGEEGELWIGGVGVTPGYLNAPELTEKLFIPNPFGEGFVYLTGDLIKRIDGGKGPYLFVRRIDDQVKINGFRIELAEIETVFATHPLIDTAIAVVRDGKLILYVKKADDGSSARKLSKDELNSVFDFAARSLMYYMMPKNIVFVEKFPIGATGKCDRKSLPPPPPDSAVEFVNHNHGGQNNNQLSQVNHFLLLSIMSIYDEFISKC